MAHKLQQWYARHKLLTWVITGLLLTYTLAGFVAAPLAIHHVLKKKGSQALGRDVQAETVRFNPYTFSLRLTGLSVSGVDGPLVRIGVFYVNVDPLISLFKWGFVVNVAPTAGSIFPIWPSCPQRPQQQKMLRLPNHCGWY